MSKGVKNEKETKKQISVSEWAGPHPFPPRFGCCADVKKMQWLQECGYDYAELPLKTVKVGENEEVFEEVKDYVSSFIIKPEVFNSFLPSYLKIVGDRVCWDEVTQFVTVAFRRVKELEGQIVVFGSGDARRIAPDFPKDKAYLQLKKFLIFVADEASKYGLKIIIEHICRSPSREGQKGTNTINNILEAMRLATDLDRKNLRILADLFHMVEEGEPFSDLLKAKEYLDHIHIPVPYLNGEEIRLKDYNHSVFFTLLRKLGYNQRISIEDNNHRFEQFERDSRRALRIIRSMWDEVVYP